MSEIGVVERMLMPDGAVLMKTDEGSEEGLRVGKGASDGEATNTIVGPAKVWVAGAPPGPRGLEVLRARLAEVVEHERCRFSVRWDVTRWRKDVERRSSVGEEVEVFGTCSSADGMTDYLQVFEPTGRAAAAPVRWLRYVRRTPRRDCRVR